MPLAAITSGVPSGTQNAVPLSPTNTGVASVQSFAKTATPATLSPPGKINAIDIACLSKLYLTAASSAASIRRQPTRDLFDDDDTETAAAAAAASSIATANAKNQLESTQRSLATVQANRAKMDTSVTESAGQLAALESQLASAKAQHQTETKLVTDLQARQREQLANITKTRGELVTAESDLSALRADKAEIEGSVLRDKEEIRDLQRKLKVVGEQTTLTKAEVEKLKRDARQQKGLLAIARKQLTTAEENAEKARKEALAQQEELARIQEELDSTNAATEALYSAKGTSMTGTDGIASEAPTPDPVAFPASVPLPETPEVQSPSIAAKSNNPFGRLTRQNSTASNTASPVAFKAFALSTPVEVGTEITTTDAAVAPLPPSTDDAGRSDDPFNAAFGIEEATEEHEALKTLLEATLPPDHSVSAALPAAENAESFAPPELHAAATGVSESVLEVPQPLEDHDSNPDPPQVHTQSEPKPVEATGRQQDEDSSDDDTAEPEDAFGPKPHRLNQAIMPETFENDVSHEPSFPSTSVATTSTDQGASTQTSEYPAAPVSNAAFDNTFGLSEPTAPAVPAGIPSTAPAASPFSALPPPPSAKNGRGSPASKPSTTFSDPPLPAVRSPTLDDASRPASTAELDAAFGGKPTMSETTINESPKPIFKESFDDAFDFGSASTSNPPNTTTPLTNGHPTTVVNGPSTWLSGILRSGETPTATPTRQPAYSPPAGPPPPRATDDTQRQLSFDDAFGPSREIPAFTAIPAPAPIPVPPFLSAAAAAPAVAPHRDPLSDNEEDNRPLSQSIDRERRRSMSPPIPRSRMSISPPPASKSSGKGQVTKDDGGSKSSKLSLHFPFGKHKNKNKDKASSGSSKKGGVALPDSPNIDEHGSYRAPPPVHPSQRPRRASHMPAPSDVIGSGGPDDDIAAVKTLVNMGFTRQQAVDALEQNSYDVPTALNKLLGTA